MRQHNQNEKEADSTDLSAPMPLIVSFKNDPVPETVPEPEPTPVLVSADPNILLACPFCGDSRIKLKRKANLAVREHPEWENEPDAYNYLAVCTGCEVRGPIRRHRANAIKAWNTR